MLDTLTILAQLLGLMAALIVLGEPLRLLLSKTSRLFKNLGFIETCVLDVYLGGLILYVLALPPLHLFSVPMIFGLLLASGVISSIYHWMLRKRSQVLTRHNEERQGKVIEQAFVFGLFLIALCVQMIPLTFLIYGSIHDMSFHSLTVQVILENKYIPNNLEPYLPEGIIYPQASHVIFAFAANLTGWIAPQAITYVTPLFNALTVLGAYFFAKRLWRNRGFYLGVVFIFTFVAAWPMFITWGANPFVVGFALFLVCLGMIFALFSDSSKKDKKELFVVGILFGYLSAMMISFLQSLMVITILWLLFQYLRKSAGVRNSLKEFVFLFAVSILPLSPFLFRFTYYYPYPGHNIGLPQDFMGYPRAQHWLMQGVRWSFENLTPYLALSLEMACIVILGIVLFFKVGKGSISKKAFSAALLIFAASVLLSIVPYWLPLGLGIISWGHQGIILVISLYLLMATFNNSVFAFFCRVTSSKFSKGNFKEQFYVALLSSILLLSAVYAPFVYARFALDPLTLWGSYSMFAVTSEDDNKLMLWMRANLTKEAVILVNKYEPGLFIPAVSYRKTVFTTPGSQLSRNYQELISLIRNDTLNSTSYNILNYFNITHVYVGSSATYGWIQDYKWKPQLFLGNPNFPLVKRMGNAYLFNFSYNDPSVVFLDDFEHCSWYEYGWQRYFLGNGLGNVTIKTDFEYNGSRCLRITTQAVHTVSEWKYINWVRREIFVLNNSNVQLSFYLNATEGFHGKDAFAVLISNIYHNQSIVITTPNGIHKDYRYTKSLDRFEGPFDFNLTAMWHQTFNSSLPNPFILELVNYDFDGVENVAYVDNITVTSTPVD